MSPERFMSVHHRLPTARAPPAVRCSWSGDRRTGSGWLLAPPVRLRTRAQSFCSLVIERSTEHTRCALELGARLYREAIAFKNTVQPYSQRQPQSSSAGTQREEGTRGSEREAPPLAQGERGKRSMLATPATAAAATATFGHLKAVRAAGERAHPAPYDLHIWSRRRLPPALLLLVVCLFVGYWRASGD